MPQIVLFSDGETWETWSDRILMVEVSPDQHARLCQGEKVRHVVPNYKGTPIAPVGQVVEFFDATLGHTRTEGPWERVHMEGRALVGVNGDQRTAIATLNDDGLWVDNAGHCWVDVAVKGGAI